MKIAVFDIETSDLSAVGPGVLICAVFKPLGEPCKTLRYDELHCRPGHEKKLVEAVIAEIDQYDLLIGHNIDNFDYPWLKSRALYFGLDRLPRPFSYDTCKAFRRLNYKTAINNHNGKPIASLAFAVDFFGVEQRKTPIYPRQHWQTVWGEGEERTKAIDGLAEHCVSDVQMNEEIYWRLMRADYLGRLERLK